MSAAPPALLAIPDELTALTASLATFIEREALPVEREHSAEFHATGRLEEAERLRLALRRKSADAGFYTLFLPEDVGGGGVGMLGLVLAYETQGKSGSYLAERGGVLPSVEGPTPVLLGCDEQQRKEYLEPTMRADRQSAFALTEPDAGSDAAAIRTRAVRDGDHFVVNGTKHFITHGAYADYVLLFAVTDPGRGARGGITCFLVDTDTPGFTVVGKQQTMYDDHQAELAFADMRVHESKILGQEGMGFYAAMHWINGGRLQIAGTCLGIAGLLVRRMTAYAATRTAFGKPIGSNQYVQGYCVDSLVELESARYLVYMAADRVDRGVDARAEAAKAKYAASEMVGRVADRAIQVFGGNGFMTATGIERYARLVRSMRLYEGTSEVLKTNIAKGMGL